jgi:hypothetical protein
MGLATERLVHHRKTSTLPVFERSLVVHLGCRHPAMADAPLHGLDGTLLFQGLGDECSPGGVRPDPFGHFGFLCRPHKKVVHLLAGQRIVRLSVWLLLSRQNQRGFPLVFVSRGLDIFLENDLKFLVNGQAISFSAFHQKIQNRVSPVFVKIFHLERADLADPAAGVKENMEDRLVDCPELWRTGRACPARPLAPGPARLRLRPGRPGGRHTADSGLSRPP